MLKKAIFNLIAYQDESKNSIFNLLIFILIIISIILLIIESINDIYAEYRQYIDLLSKSIMTIFVFEYCLRVYISDLTHPASSKFKSILKFVFSFYGIIDLLALLPFLLPFLLRVDFRFIRILRIFKFFRILKLNRYMKSLLLIKEIIIDKKNELISTLILTFFMIFISGFLMYYIENPAQPEVFSNVLVSMWWSVATLTTVGYGDIYPITPMGKLVSGIISLLGIGVVALPTGLISVGYLERIKKDNPAKEN
jgi:voltage-gated potassium channel